MPKPNIVLFASLLGALLVPGLVFMYSEKKRAESRNAELTMKLSQLFREKGRLQAEARKTQDLLRQKDEALTEAAKQNFQTDLLAAQASLREANGRLEKLIREKSDAQNTSIVMESRLKNTTNELTRTLQELKNARETLSGIEEQYRAKIEQLSESIRRKDEHLARTLEGLGEKEISQRDFYQREKDVSESMRKYQARVAELEAHMSRLNSALLEKEKMLAQLARTGVKPQAGDAGSGTISAAALEKERIELEKQLAVSSSRLFEQQDEINHLQENLSSLKETLSQRESLLFKKEKELARSAEEAARLKDEILSLKAAASYASQTGPILSETQQQLQKRIRQLEKEKSSLEDRLRETETRRPVAARASDPLADRNFRVLTETLVKKEEQIKSLEDEIGTLKSQKIYQESGAGAREKRLVELEILVETLTKQLGEYAGFIEKKDVALKADEKRIAALAQELEAQKIAALALQKELADARQRQEKTFQSLTQVIGINAGSGARSPGFVANQKSPPEKSESRDAQKRADELRKQVEVMLEGKTI